MLSKKLCVLALLCAAVMVGCGDKEKGSGKVTADNAPAAADVTSAGAPDDEEPAGETEVPTDPVHDVISSGDFEYELVKDHVVITKYIGIGGDVVVPAKIDDTPVTEIGYYAFEAKYGVTSVTLPTTIEAIGQFAFMDCSDLKTINIPDKVKGLERGTFASCSSLDSIVLHKNISYVREEAFTGCTALKKLVIYNPDLKYENWGIEKLTDLTVYSPDRSHVFNWADEDGFFSRPLEDL